MSNPRTLTLARLETLAKSRRPTFLEEMRACGTPTPNGLALVFDTESECWRKLMAAKAQRPMWANVSPPSQPVPREKWPMTVRIVARLALPGEKGVGQTLTRLIAGVGGEAFKQLAAAIGVDCGCAARAAALDAKYPYQGPE